MYLKEFKPHLLAVSIAAVFAGNVYAQEANEQNLAEKKLAEQNEQVEIIEVTGIRGSLLKSMDLKREAKGIVDGISAEDIGKFPDTNLAESLQRITGIAIERDRGEGSKITVRGFGPDFNIVTFNSRQMPTTGGRSFDFGNIASEGISAVEVYKSGRANVATGGIGAVVNVKTTKPLDKPDQHGAFKMSGVHDTGTREGKSVSPEFAALYSNTFADDTIGVSLSFSYQERDGGAQSATTQDFYTRNFVSQEDIDAFKLANPGEDHPDNEWGTIVVGDPDAVNFPTEVVEGNYSIPTNIQYNLDDFHRERINGQLTLQWQPIESLTATLDYTYAENQYNTKHQDLSAWFDPGCSTRESEWIQEGNIWSPTYYSQGCSAENNQGVGLYATVDENKSLGMNIKWQPTDNLSMSLDYHDSSGEGRPNSKHGSGGAVAVAAQNRITTNGYFSKGGMPVLEVELGERNSHNQIVRRDEFTLDEMQLTGSNFGSFTNRMDVEQLQFDSKYEFDEGHSIDFGIGRVEVTNRGQSTSVSRDSWGGVGDQPGDIADLLKIEDMGSVFNNLDGSGDPRQKTEYITWNFQDLIDRGEALLKTGDHGDIPSGSGDGGSCLTGFCPSYDFSTDEVTTEESNSIYIQGHFVADPFDMPMNLFVGLRYEETEVHSEALVPLPDYIEWTLSNTTNRLSYYTLLDENNDDVTGFSEIDGDYDMLLPSLDFDIEVVEDVILRASYSLTVTRPVYNDLKGALNIGGFNEDGGNGSRGNPQLLPMESENVDLSAEWYYDDVSYVSVGYWTKEVDNFIVNQKFEDQTLFTDLYTPIEGPLYKEAVNALTGGDDRVSYTNEELTQYFVENFADEPNVVIEGEDDDVEITIIGIALDPVATLDVTIPVNQNKTTVKGWEVALQHTFGESGFGLQANFTIVEGDLEFDINNKEEQWVVPGMSDTANLVVFYEKNGFQARVAYNWRDKYVQSAGDQPRFVEEYAQIDANVSYEVTDDLSIFVEGINLTEENQRIHGRSSYQVRRYEVGHVRYNMGVHYKF